MSQRAHASDSSAIYFDLRLSQVIEHSVWINKYMKKKHTDSHYCHCNILRPFAAQFSYRVKQINPHLRPLSDHRHPCFDCPCDPVWLPSTLVWVCWAPRSLLADVPYFRPYSRTTNSLHCEGKVGLQYRPGKLKRTIDVGTSKASI